MSDSFQFEVYGKGLNIKPNIPQITIQKNGRISFNQAAQDVLGDTDYLLLLFDPKANVIGFRPNDGSDATAYVLNRNHISTTATCESGQNFTKHIGLAPLKTSLRFVAKGLDDGTLAVDLNQEPGTVQRNRAVKEA